jgi:hypothetical protein
MNFAFPALVVFILTLPGIIAGYWYRKGDWPIPIYVRPIAEETAYSVIIAAMLHTPWATFLHLTGFHIDLEPVLMFLVGSFGKDNDHLVSVVRSVTDHPSRVVIYFFGLYLLSAVTGFAAHKLVRTRGWDRKYEFLRFDNFWFYLFEGEILEFPDIPSAPQQIDGVYLSAVVQHGERSYLYRGVVEQYYFDRSGNLDRVLLALAARRDLSDDRAPDQQHQVEGDSRYYGIEGDFFVLRYSEMKTICIEYFVLSPTVPSIDQDVTNAAA